MTKAPANIGASVRARLLNLARERAEDFQLLLTRYANERLLYRLAQSTHGKALILKGASLFTLWTGRPHRATRDVDLLGFGDPSEAHVREILAEALTLDVRDDGVRFDSGSLEVEPIREDQQYGGVRAVIVARVAAAAVRLQVDIGFGDVVTPEAIDVDFPTLLDFPAPRLRAYPRETVVAEKVEAMVHLGFANTRMKDFYDLVILSTMFAYDGQILAEAIWATFERRKTPIPNELPVGLTASFTQDATKRAQWAAFVRKSGAGDADDLPLSAAKIATFVQKPLAAAAGRAAFRKQWAPGGPWI